ncbi:YibE/F family protein [Patescibacteria group bacterium]|nr:YibE/F family protein [Patescibacteria group bacterium]
MNKFLLSLCFLVALFFPVRSFAQDASSVGGNAETLEGKITTVSEEKTIEVMGNKQLYQKLEIAIAKGSLAGHTITVENGNQPLANIVHYQVGDKVTVIRTSDPDGHDVFAVNDFVRRDKLFLLLLIFLAVTLLVARWKGVSSLISLSLTFLIIFKVLLPLLANGANPILIALIAAVLVIPVTFYLSHGLNHKTTVAIFGAWLSLIITGALAFVFIRFVHLSGLASEDAATLSLYKPGLLNMQGLLFAGIIIGVLGILDDITAAQASVVQELKTASPKIKKWDLYKKAMNVGHDHITSMVNTLILVYAGAALPLLLIFVDNPHPFSEIINYEFISEEIVRTLVGGIGLVLAVPITTLIAVMIFSQRRAKEPGLPEDAPSAHV